MSEQPKGLTGECCKVGGTYASERGYKQYYAVGDRFGTCPDDGLPTRWEKVT